MLTKRLLDKPAIFHELNYKLPRACDRKSLEIGINGLTQTQISRLPNLWFETTINGTVDGYQNMVCELYSSFH